MSKSEKLCFYGTCKTCKHREHRHTRGGHSIVHIQDFSRFIVFIMPQHHMIVSSKVLAVLKTTVEMENTLINS